MGLILNSLISANVSAIGEVTIGVIDKELFDDLLQKVPEDLRVFFTALVERLKATTDKLGRIGVELENRETKVVTEIIAIRDVVEVSRTESELVCKGELLTDDGGVNDVIKMTISDWDGKFMIQYSSYPEYQEGIYEELLDLIDEITD